jgi:hypothetical protein
MALSLARASEFVISYAAVTSAPVSYLFVRCLLAFEAVCVDQLGAQRKFQATFKICTF